MVEPKPDSSALHLSWPASGRRFGAEDQLLADGEVAAADLGGGRFRSSLGIRHGSVTGYFRDGLPIMGHPFGNDGGADRVAFPFRKEEDVTNPVGLQAIRNDGGKSKGEDVSEDF